MLLAFPFAFLGPIGSGTCSVPSLVTFIQGAGKPPSFLVEKCGERVSVLNPECGGVDSCDAGSTRSSHRAAWLTAGVSSWLTAGVSSCHLSGPYLTDGTSPPDLLKNITVSGHLSLISLLSSLCYRLWEK